MRESKIGIKNPNYKNGWGSKKEKILKDSLGCKICSITTPLVIHHLDKNETNNVLSNIVVLCNQCHNNIHQRGYNFTNREWVLNVSEWFTSIQGEGLSSGTPCHFIRLFGCNLNCWFCDSKFSRVGTEYKKLKYIDIINLCKEWRKKYPNIGRIIISGGEVFLQNIIPLLMILKIFNFKVEIETNGTLPSYGMNDKNLIQQVYKKELVDQINICPKLEGSQEKGKVHKMNNKSKFEQFKNFNYIVKFVIGNRKDLYNAKLLIEKCSIPKERIWLMPLTIFNEEKDLGINKLVWQMCLENNYRFCYRLHVAIWGNKRGK